ncbi:SOS response-associated peptidase family protein, partial [Halobium palmae]
LMRHHTATHVVGYAAREVLGDHVRQAGAQKGVDSSRFDVTHYERITRDEVKEIERVANELVMDNVAVKQEWPDRHAAEEKHGFDLYQGGIPPGEQIRLIQVAEDVQACGGTHVQRTGDIGAIKVLTTEPNDVVADLHDRMAVVLAPDEESTWLRGDADDAYSLLDPYPDDGLRAYPVSTRVNSPGNDDASLVDRVEA